MDWWGEFPRLEPGDGQKGMHMMWQNGLSIVLLLFLILSLVLSFLIITKHVIIMISSWRSWHKCFFNHSQTNPLLRRLKRVRESRSPSPSTRNFFVFTLLTTNLLPFVFVAIASAFGPPCFAATCHFCFLPALCVLCGVVLSCTFLLSSPSQSFVSFTFFHHSILFFRSVIRSSRSGLLVVNESWPSL